MANFNNRGGGSRFSGGSRPSFGGNNFGKPSFAKKPWGEGRSSDRPVALHKATCVECSKPCEVPFRPMNGKPVYCKECFDKKGGNAYSERGGDRGGQRYPREDRFPKRDFSSHSSIRPQFESPKGGDNVEKQLEAVNSKLERLIRAVEALTPSMIIPGDAKISKADAVVSVKISKKKAVKK